MIYGVCELVLMYRQTDAVFVFIEYRKPVVHVGAFLIRYPLDTLVMYRAVIISCHLYRIARYFKQVTQSQQYAQIYTLFRYSVR